MQDIDNSNYRTIDGAGKDALDSLDDSQPNESYERELEAEKQEEIDKLAKLLKRNSMERNQTTKQKDFMAKIRYEVELDNLYKVISSC